MPLLAALSQVFRQLLIEQTSSGRTSVAGTALAPIQVCRDRHDAATRQACPDWHRVRRGGSPNVRPSFNALVSEINMQLVTVKRLALL
jgi:hypothetical protein